MKKLFFISIITCISISLNGADKEPLPVPPKGEIVDRVAAVVNGKPITEMEVESRLAMMKKSKKIGKDLNKNKILDQLISEKIIAQIAEDEAIQITEAKIDNQIAEMMKRTNLSDKAAFLKRIESEQGITNEMLRLQIKQQLTTEQVMMYAVDFAPLSPKEVKDWYEKNKHRPEFLQINMKHILIISKSDSLADQKAANERINGILKRVKSGSSFEDIARKESHDPGSASKGGDLGWAPLAQLDPYFANEVFRQYRAGTISGIIKSTFGYHIVKFIGKRISPFEDVGSGIANMLSHQKRGEQFTKWLERKRSEAEIKIHMEGYSRPKENNEKSADNSRR